jgi:hypothetical protein
MKSAAEEIINSAVEAHFTHKVTAESESCKQTIRFPSETDEHAVDHSSYSMVTPDLKQERCSRLLEEPLSAGYVWFFSVPLLYFV